MQNQKSYTIEQAKRALENYCVYQERCHQDVYRKLQSMRMIPDAIDLIIVHLIEHNFLNETRFAKAFVTGKFRIKKWGKKRIEMELKRRDISNYNIMEAFKEISDINYLKTFHELAEKKLHSINESNIYKKKKKLADYLLYRGWESHLVYDKVNELI
mgnify:CR=1 FL=1